MIAEKADGDARVGLNMLEACIRATIMSDEKRVSLSSVQSCIPNRFVRYDKHDEEHANIISALHDSIVSFIHHLHNREEVMLMQPYIG